MLALLGLFLAAFLAATLIPAQSEAVFVALMPADSHPVWLLLAVATTGNVLGALVNWFIGRCQRPSQILRQSPMCRCPTAM